MPPANWNKCTSRTVYMCSSKPFHPPRYLRACRKFETTLHTMVNSKKKEAIQYSHSITLDDRCSMVTRRVFVVVAMGKKSSLRHPSACEWRTLHQRFRRKLELETRDRMSAFRHYYLQMGGRFTWDRIKTMMMCDAMSKRFFVVSSPVRDGNSFFYGIPVSLLSLLQLHTFPYIQYATEQD
jgi:hypothetical protein